MKWMPRNILLSINLLWRKYWKMYTTQLSILKSMRTCTVGTIWPSISSTQSLLIPLSSNWLLWPKSCMASMTKMSKLIQPFRRPMERTRAIQQVVKPQVETSLPVQTFHTIKPWLSLVWWSDSLGRFRSICLAIDKEKAEILGSKPRTSCCAWRRELRSELFITTRFQLTCPRMNRI